MIKWLKNLFGYVVRITTSAIRCTTIYNTEKNFIVLIQYGSQHFYDVMEFINCANRAGLKIILAHNADISNQSDMLPVESGLETKVPAKIINHRYYMLVSGEPTNYANIAHYLSLSNPVYDAILTEAYQHITSTAFSKLIEDHVLNEDSFKYIRVRPPYDELQMVVNPINDTGVTYHDDVNLILSKLPNCFDAIDIARIIHIYTNSHWSNGLSEYVCADKLIDKLFTYKNGETNTDEYANLSIHISLLRPLYARLVPEFSAVTSSTDCLAILSYPIYLREGSNSAGDDADGIDASSGALDARQVDELFTQQYDRFTLPTADNMTNYKSLDEVLNTTPIEPVNPSSRANQS